MLELAEKVSTAVCALMVIAVALGYALIGTGSTTPIEFVEPVVTVDLPPANATPPALRQQGQDASSRAAAAHPQVDEDALRAKLRQQGVPARTIAKKAATVPASTFEYVQHEANWVRELKNYRSTFLRSPQGNTRLRIEGIRENTLLRKLGFEDGDTLELVNGEILEYNEESSWRYRSLAKEAIETLRNDGSISVTVTRDRKPVHLIFSLR